MCRFVSHDIVLQGIVGASFGFILFLCFAYLLFVFYRERQRELPRPLDGLLMRMIRLLLLKFLLLKILGMRLVVLLGFFVVGVFFSRLICDYIFFDVVKRFYFRMQSLVYAEEWILQGPYRILLSC